MAKIFISYKYADSNVQPINNHRIVTVRDYVDEIQKMIGEDHINKGENDGEDMSSLSDSTIQSKLGDKIYDSTVTLILISPNMRDTIKSEKDQWIPWEVSYSLREQSRNGRTSKSNAMLAVVLPDSDGSYDYFLEEHYCLHCNSTIYKTNTLFGIMSDNMFNKKSPIYLACQYHIHNKPQTGYYSYIHTVKWADFKDKYQDYIDTSIRLKENIAEYNITKTLK